MTQWKMGKVKTVCTVLGSVVFLGTSLMGCSLLPQEPEEHPIITQGNNGASQYAYEEVTRGEIQVMMNLECHLSGYEYEELKFAVGGVAFGETYVKVGDSVKKGQLLMQLDMKDLEEPYEDAQYELSQLKLDMDYIDTQIADEKKLCELQGVSQKEMDDRLGILKDSKDVMQSQYNVQQQLVSEYAKKIEERKIYAAMDGTVEWLYNPYAYLDKKDGEKPIITKDMEMVAISHYEEGETPQLEGYAEGDVRDLFHPGMTLQMETDSGVYDVAVVKVTDDWHDTKVLLEFVEQPDVLVPSGHISQTIDSATDALIVSKSAVSQSGDQYYVYMVNGDGIRELREVEVGITDGYSIEIKSGLSEGDKVIVR